MGIVLTFVRNLCCLLQFSTFRSFCQGADIKLLRCYVTICVSTSTKAIAYWREFIASVPARGTLLSIL